MITNGVPAPDGVTQEIKTLEYESLPYLTHPIDIAKGSQGWGPMAGPYSPVDFVSAKDIATGGWGLDTGYDSGDNAVTVAPTFDVLTLMQDRSLDLVNNAGTAAVLAHAHKSSRTATIHNADSVQTSGVASNGDNAGFWQSVRNFFAVGSDS